MTTRYGIIGCGMMGQEHLRNIALLDDAVASVVCEPDPEMAGIAKTLAPDAKITGSLDALLDEDGLDCVVIATPNFLHVEHLEAVMARRSLPILIEKPLYTETDDLAKVRALVRDYSAPLWVAMEYRYMPPMQEFLRRLEEVTGGIKMLTITEHRFPFLGKVDSWNRRNSKTGGTFVEKCCHFFDLMRLITRSDPVRVMASGGQEVNGTGEQSDVWDCGFAIVDFANGARASLELSMFAEGSEYQEMIHAIGGEGKIEVNIPGPTRFWRGGDAVPPPAPHVIASPRSGPLPTRIDCPVDEKALDAGDHNGATYYQHLKFLEVVRGGGGVEVTLDDGIWAVRMGLAAQESAITGKAVDIKSA